MSDLHEKVHGVQLDMALEVKRICEKNNIKYSIIAGTLLGAVRHKGFIPWDDDLDIGMLREDYEKFIKVCCKELNDDYFLQTWESDYGFALPIAKLRKKGTVYIEKNSSKSDLHHGIYIDIFPFDNVPTNIIAQKIQNYITYILKRILLVKQNYEVWEQQQIIKKIIYKLVDLLTKPFSLEMIKRMLLHQMIKYNTNNTEMIVTFGGAYGYWKESIKRCWLENLINIKFEEYELSCIENYNTYLTYLYGDYMIPPSENKRYNRHNIIDINLGENIK